MSYLLNQINEVNETFAEAGSFVSDVGMFTGFTPLDVVSSNVARLGDLDIKILNGGVFNNPYNGIGMSAIGKTTLWIQIVSSAMDKWYKYYGPVSECTFYNVENHTSPERWKAVTGYTDRMMAERVRFINKHMSIREIFNDIAIMAREKAKYRDELEINTGIRSLDGEVMKVLPTTYVIVDSIASVRTETDIKFDKDGNVRKDQGIAGTNNMDAMHIAKENTIFINEVKKLCEDVNICVILINHMVEIPVLDRYNPPKPILPSMPYNQKLKGGNELIYQSFGVYMLVLRERLFNEKTKVFGDMVHGVVALAKILKNKNGREGVAYPMVFDSMSGFKPELTDFEILWTEGMYGISGSPASLRMDILPEITFTRKTLLQKCYDNPLLARAIGMTTRLKLVSNLLLRKEAPDIKGIGELPFEARVDLIMSHSEDYPGYENYGYVVDRETLEQYNTLLDSTYRSHLINRYIDSDNIEIFKTLKGQFTPTDFKFEAFDYEKLKVGKTEYCQPVSMK